MTKSPPPTVIAWDELPMVCTIEHIVKLYGLTVSGIYRIVGEHLPGLPPPFMTSPMRWSREDLRRHLEGATQRPRVARRTA